MTHFDWQGFEVALASFAKWRIDEEGCFLDAFHYQRSLEASDEVSRHVLGGNIDHCC